MSVADAVAAALGRPVIAVKRLRGGTSKGVHRVHLGDGSTVVAYVWDPSEDWWSSVRPDAEPDDVFAERAGLVPFLRAQDELARTGVSVSRVFATRERTPEFGDLAVVQDLPRSLEELLSGDPTRALDGLADTLRRMASTRSPTCGPLDAPLSTGFSGAVLDRALRHVDSAAAREPRIAAVATELRRELRDRAAAVRPREGFSLVHGELGPDHVRLDAADRPHLVDVEGVSWGEPEWEHAFLELRFGPHYDALRSPGLDEDRLRSYRLANYVSLVEGPLRLLETGFPERGFMRSVVESNLTRTLAALRR